MQDIREVVQSALDEAFIEKVDVTAEEPYELPDEYITYMVVSAVYTEFANGRPIQRRDNIDVTWYGKDIKKKASRMAEIESAMTAAGFYVVDLPYDLPRDDGTDYYGSTMEFSLYRVVPREN